jgi:hypothetical protein
MGLGSTTTTREDTMRMTSRHLALGLAIAALGVVPATGAAKHGADDGPARAGDDNGGLRGDAASGRDDGGEIRVRGTCTGRATAKLKAKHDDGRLEVEFEVDQNRNGVSWRVVIRRNGAVAVSTRAVTRAPSGSFSVERRIADPAGKDRVTARAVSPSGQVCRASLAI